jgi:bifunctional UDP-N-acetylglucosamine pyrophosphorylase/glucosamine-1-phosphate N-acetyltransferase
MAAGVQLADPNRLDIRGRLTAGSEVRIDVGCVFEGQVELGDHVQIGPNVVLKNVRIEAGARIEAMSHLEDCSVGPRATIGPFARIRPGSVLAEGSHVGNFTELKNTRLGPYSKANHLSYLGDAQIGARVNVGAGTITCNYDGAEKHRTVIEDDVFIGSDTQLVAPVVVHEGATLGAGTTLTADAPAHQLTLSRTRQTSVARWKRPKKQSH